MDKHKPRPLTIKEQYPQHGLRTALMIHVVKEPGYRVQLDVESTGTASSPALGVFDVQEAYNLLAQHYWTLVRYERNTGWTIILNQGDEQPRQSEFMLTAQSMRTLLSLSHTARSQVLQDAVTMYDELKWIAGTFIELTQEIRNATPRAALAAKHTLTEYIYKQLLVRLRQQHAYERTVTNHWETGEPVDLHV